MACRFRLRSSGWGPTDTTMREDLVPSSNGSEVESKARGCTSTYRSVVELAADLGLSERSTRAALRRGEIPHIRVGRRFILPKAAIAEWLRTAGRSTESGSSSARPARLVAVLGGQR
jgi:excisionase family DNA binding protein